LNLPLRRFRRASIRICLLFAAIAATTVRAAEPTFELKDGDRVVLLGGTFIERDQAYGYLETLLTARHPGKNITFRNLGWSGDTVWGEARSRFGPPAEGFAHLKEHVEALKPTVLLVNYGLNESFAGKAGLARFEQGLNTLLDVLDKTGARIVLITPRKLETLPPPLPDPAAANQRLADYVAVLKRTAEKRKYRVVDLFNTWSSSVGQPSSETEDCVQLSDHGYSVAAGVVGKSLFGPGREGHAVKLDANGAVLDGTSSKVEDVRVDGTGLSFRLTEGRLPAERIEARRLEVIGLPPGRYEVAIDDRVAGVGTVKDGRLTCPIESGPEFDQVERLREAVNAKNELYFHRWRPQNETYLFGFRKHEQGNNAREIPLFDPLVAAQEAEIARLRTPVAHTYRITRKGDGR
jgi:hypothetical protein